MRLERRPPVERWQGREGTESGMALLITLLAMMLMAVIGGALLLTTTVEVRVVRNFRSRVEAVYAADAALELAAADLATMPDWNPLLAGAVRSSFVDGAPDGPRILPGGVTLDLTEFVNTANCGKTSACSSADLSAVTADRPWGPNNPVWRPFVHGRLTDFAPGSRSVFYLVVLVGDDPAENDGDPLQDGDDATNPGSGVLVLRAEVFGPWGAHAVVEQTVVRPAAAAAVGAPPGAVRLVSWREVR
jgi:Tfp pilus assembly protein PilV